jgi:hypothetical protein
MTFDQDAGFSTTDPAAGEITASQYAVAERPLDVDSDDFDDEPEPLPISARRRRLSIITALLALAAMGAAGFYAGVLVQKHQKSSGSSSAAALSALASRFGAGGRGAAGAAGAGAAGGGGFGGGGRVNGSVKLIDGSNVYVVDAQGNTVKVATNAGSQFSKTVTGAFSDLKIGDRVTIQGPQGADGTYQAQQVTIGGAGGTGRGFGGGGGGGGATGGSAVPGG